MATVLGSLLVELGLESGAFKSGLTAAQKELRKAQKGFEQVGQSMSDFGSKLSVAVTAPLVAMGVAAVKGATAQRAAMAQVEAPLESMGAASGKTAKELAKAADAMELRSLYDADVILKEVTANLLTFGNVAGKQFDRAQQAAIDMATRLEIGPKSAAIQLGKALNNPIKGITALTKAGVDFTDQQKAQIKAMTEAGNIAGAQGVILAEVEKQFRGAAAAAADTSPWRQAQVAIGQAMDAVGEAILPVLPVITGFIVRLAQAFQSLSPEAQKTIVVIAALAAALGPLMVAVGFAITSMAPFLAAISAIGASGGIVVAAKAALVGLSTAFWPIAAAAAAVYLAWQNWDTIKPILADLLGQIRAFAEGLGLVEANASATTEELNRFADNRRAGEELRSISTALQKAADDFDAFNAANRKWAVENGATIPQLLQSAWTAFQNFTQQLNGFGLAVKSAFADLANGAVNSMRALALGVKQWLQDKLAAVFAWVGEKTRQVSGYFFDMYDAVVGHSYVPDMVEGIAAEMARLQGVMVSPARAATGAVTDSMRAMAQDTTALLSRLFPEVERLMGYRRDLAAIDKLGMSDDQKTEARRRAGQLYRGETPGSRGSSDVISASTENIYKGLTVANDMLDKFGSKGEAVSVRVAQSFKDMAAATLSALDRLAGAMKGGGFLDILGAVIGLGLQLGSAGLFGKKVQGNLNKSIPGFANGTNFAPGGLSLVGERGPELVNLPRGAGVMSNRELRNLGGTSVQVIPSPYFDVVVDGRVQRAAPGIASAGAGMATDGMVRSRKWALS